jgi:hypothetical protein
MRWTMGDFSPSNRIGRAVALARLAHGYIPTATTARRRPFHMRWARRPRRPRNQPAGSARREAKDRLRVFCYYGLAGGSAYSFVGDGGQAG